MLRIFLCLALSVLASVLPVQAEVSWLARITPALTVPAADVVYRFRNGDRLIRLSSDSHWLAGEAIPGDRVRYLYPDRREVHAATASVDVALSAPPDPGQPFLQQDGFLDLPEQQRHCDSVPIAILDSGVDTSHARLQSVQFLSPYNVVQDQAGVEDGYGHGTHVAGLIAASDNGQWWGACVSATLIPVRFLGNDGGGRVSDAIEGIEWAINAGARMINHSWTVRNPNPALFDVLQDADQRGLVQVAAAGNQGSDLDSHSAYPVGYAADLNALIGVANWDGEQQTLSSTSNRGLMSVDIAASGSNLLSLMPGDQEIIRSGTSMATPLVAAAMAMNWAKEPADSARQQRARLLASCQQHDNLLATVRCGGRLHAAALQSSPAIAVWSVDDDEQGMLLLGEGLDQVDQWRFYSWVDQQEQSLSVTQSSTRQVRLAQQAWPAGEWRWYQHDRLLGRYPYIPALKTPEHLSLNVSDDGLLLSWAGDTRASEYLIEWDQNLNGFTELARVQAPVSQYLHRLPDGIDPQQTVLRYRVQALLPFGKGGSSTQATATSALSDIVALNLETFIWQTEALAQMPPGAKAEIPLALASTLSSADVSLDSSSDTGFSMTNSGVLSFQAQQPGNYRALVQYQSGDVHSQQEYRIAVTDQDSWALALWNQDALILDHSNVEILGFQRLVDGRVRLDLNGIQANSLVTLQLRSDQHRLHRFQSSILGDNTAGVRLTRQDHRNVLIRFAPESNASGRATLFLTLDIRSTRIKAAPDARCFIASVLLQQQPEALAPIREFRDQILMQQPAGRWLVEQYYQVSPAIAAYLDESPRWRQVLTPLMQGLAWLLD